MAEKDKKGNKVTLRLEGVEGNTTVAGDSVIQGAASSVARKSHGGNVVDVEAKNYKGNITAAGADVIVFNTHLNDLRAELLHAYAGRPEVSEIIEVSDELAVEAARPPEARDASRARRAWERLQQFALDVGAKVAAGVMVEAAKNLFLS